MSHFSILRPSARSRVRLGVLACATAAMLLLTGCQGSGTPTNTGSTTPPPTETATATPTPAPSAVYKPADANGRAENVPVPEMPALAKENTKEGLEAFVKYYYAVKNYANETGDVTTLATLNGPDCAACSSLLEATSQSYIEGRWMAGGKLEVPVIEVHWNPNNTVQTVKQQVIQGDITYYNSDGSEGRAPDIATNSAFVIVASFDASWTVADLGVLR